MEQDVESVAQTEAAFEIQEVLGPAFALEQQGDTAQTSTQPPERQHPR